MNSRQFPYVQLDVFSSTPLEGNMLAVFHDAQGLSDDEMQAIARETNLSETTFIVPRDAVTEAREGVKVRIFTWPRNSSSPDIRPWEPRTCCISETRQIRWRWL